ncbi:MAG: aminopeptidase N [Paracoccaceae bacterium]|nr:aminopeptidase N [Paracoccaceae bacterium]
MKDAATKTIYLKDYTAPAYLVDKVHLTFRLHPTQTRVISRVHFRPNPDSNDNRFTLHGEEMQLIQASLDGQPCHPLISDGVLTTQAPDAPFIWEAEVEISPKGNTALEGLYMSGSMYCTQCEAEGFRKITFYPDRPDVMARFTVRIESSLPILLSNGNPTAKGECWAEWYDPWPKPAYLFALVAGDLIAHTDNFTTRSGTDVALNIWVRPGDEDKCSFGMSALKNSMRWDEEVYNREYDLDIFNIVAVDDFNMGAMENKGLNIFNSSCVLASPETSTDNNFERIEAIIAHEYFHNWTGNRVTCRDWFQLCLKEGLTVFRDSQFTASQRSAPVKRINDVIDLRSRQFREDNGPLAHPVRPNSFVEINNFYTATVYEKGSELIRMLKTLVGDEAYAEALELYFDHHDGDAATIEDWLRVFEGCTGRDLNQFKVWYEQAGTPRIQVSDTFQDGRYTLNFKQYTPPTPGQKKKGPRVIPIAVGLLDQNGDEVQATTILEMNQTEQSFVFDGLSAAPIPSILRDFSAPVILQHAISNDRQAFLLTHDTDPFNRWAAGEALARNVLVDMVRQDSPADITLLDALLKVARDETLDPKFRALVLTLPSQDDIATTLNSQGHTPDPQAIWHAHELLYTAIAQHLQKLLPTLFTTHYVKDAYTPNSAQSAARSLANKSLALLTRLDGGMAAQLQYNAANNMTQQLAAYRCLLAAGKGALATKAFYQQWQNDRLVIDKWFAIQVAMAPPDQTADIAQHLTQHADFDMKNPNRFRATLGALSGSTAGFHHVSGKGYTLLADWLIRLDPLNPQTTAKMCSAFETWHRYDTDRQAKISAELHRILATNGLSRDTTEMVARILE